MQTALTSSFACPKCVLLVLFWSLPQADVRSPMHQICSCQFLWTKPTHQNNVSHHMDDVACGKHALPCMCTLTRRHCTKHRCSDSIPPKHAHAGHAHHTYACHIDMDGHAQSPCAVALHTTKARSPCAQTLSRCVLTLHDPRLMRMHQPCPRAL